MRKVSLIVGLLMLVAGCLTYSHYKFSERAEIARVLPEGVTAKSGRIYFVSFPENCLAVSILGWKPCVGHAALVTQDKGGQIKQYDYGWFCGGGQHANAIGYLGDGASYGVVQRKLLSTTYATKLVNDSDVAKMVLVGMGQDPVTGNGLYGDRVELWAKDVVDIGVAERYMEELAGDENRGSMAWRCWQIGGYRCGNIARQAFDAARGEGHFLDLLWGGFPGADAPSIGTEKKVWHKQAPEG